MMNHVEAAAIGVRAGFTQIPNAIYDLPLSKNGINVYNVLWVFKWENDPGCHPSLATIMKMSRLSKNPALAAIQELIDYRIMDCRRRGDGQTNYYRFLDPTPDDMIKRVMAMPRRPQRPRKPKPPRPQAADIPLDSLATFQIKFTPSDYLLPLAISEPLLDQFVQTDQQIETEQPSGDDVNAPQLSHEPAAAPDLNERQSDQADQQIGDQIELEKPANFRSSNFEPVRSSKSDFRSSNFEPNNTHINKTQFKTHTHARANALARVRKPQSKYSLSECIEYAASLRGIINPKGYGTAIWHDGRDDGAIAKFQADKQTQAAQQPKVAEPVVNNEAWLAIEREQKLERLRKQAFDQLSPDEREQRLQAKLEELMASEHRDKYKRMFADRLQEQLVYQVQRDLVLN